MEGSSSQWPSVYRCRRGRPPAGDVGGDGGDDVPVEGLGPGSFLTPLGRGRGQDNSPQQGRDPEKQWPEKFQDMHLF